MNLDLTSLQKSVTALERTINAYHNLDSIITADHDTIAMARAGVIQHFKFTYEISWKMMKRWIEVNYGTTVVDGVTRRELFRQAAENRLIEDVQIWMDFHKDRNQTSHIYDEMVSDEVFESAIRFLPYAKCLLVALEERNQ